MTLDCDRPPAEARARAYVLGQLSEADRTEFEDHVIGCHACAALVTRLDEALGVLERHVQEVRPASRNWRVWAVAGAAAAGIFLMVALVRQPSEELGGMDGIEPRRSGGTSDIVLVAPLGEIGASPEELVWSAGSVMHCSATIVLPDLTLVWTSPSSSAGSVRVPEEIRLALRSSSRHLWKVKCDTTTGERASSYGAFRTRPAP